MLKEVTVVLDTGDPLQAQLLADYAASSNPSRWLNQCLQLGYLVATDRLPVQPSGPGSPGPDGPAKGTRRKPVGSGLFGI